MPEKDLLLFTTAFPYGSITESSFISVELPYLCEKFRRVIIVPEFYQGKPDDLSKYHNVLVDTSRITSIDHKHPLTKLRFAAHVPVIKQLIHSVSGINPSDIPAAWSMSINRYRIGRNLESIISRHKIDCTRTVFYTFWFNHITEALTLALPEDAGILVSGAHRYDVYPGTLKVPFYRNYALGRMTKLYTVSRGSQKYMQSAYPDNADKIAIRTLGSPKKIHDLLSRQSDINEPYTLMSCSRVDENKRVWLNLQFAKRLAQEYPERQFRWIHAGDGPLMPELRRQVNKDVPENLTIKLIGAVDNCKIHEVYQTENIDWVLLLSRNEGNPIALSEAISYGVPVITCNVTGCNEIANDSVGIILSPNPTDDEFISRIKPYIENREKQLPLRQSAFARWEECYDASHLRSAFASELASLK